MSSISQQHYPVLMPRFQFGAVVQTVLIIILSEPGMTIEKVCL
jgi:hypothetical protein